MAKHRSEITFHNREGSGRPPRHLADPKVDVSPAFFDDLARSKVTEYSAPLCQDQEDTMAIPDEYQALVRDSEQSPVVQEATVADYRSSFRSDGAYLVSDSGEVSESFAPVAFPEAEDTVSGYIQQDPPPYPPFYQEPQPQRPSLVDVRIVFGDYVAVVSGTVDEIGALIARLQKGY